jgi:uncharacterized protein YqeY
MLLFDRINSDIKEAMKEKNKVKLEALRAVKAELLLLKTAEGATGEISGEAEIKLLQKMVKQRNDSAQIYKAQNRPELYEPEIEQISYLEKYLPEQISDEELGKLIGQIIQQTGAQGVKDMGKVMGIASKELAGRADGKTISAKVKELLSI